MHSRVLVRDNVLNPASNAGLTESTCIKEKLFYIPPPENLRFRCAFRGAFAAFRGVSHAKQYYVLHCCVMLRSLSI